jgi:hypothetical protein
VEENLERYVFASDPRRHVARDVSAPTAMLIATFALPTLDFIFKIILLRTRKLNTRGGGVSS